MRSDIHVVEDIASINQQQQSSSQGCQIANNTILFPFLRQFNNTLQILIFLKESHVIF